MQNVADYESLTVEICSLSRQSLIQELAHFTGPLKLDFTPEYLDTLSTDKIRHVLVAAIWRCRQKELVGAA